MLTPHSLEDVFTLSDCLAKIGNAHSVNRIIVPLSEDKNLVIETRFFQVYTEDKSETPELMRFQYTGDDQRDYLWLTLNAGKYSAQDIISLADESFKKVDGFYVKF